MAELMKAFGDEIVLYHGGPSPVEIPEIRSGRYTKDFGDAFYCTTLQEQAVRWSKKFKESWVTCFRFVKNRDLEVLDFSGVCEEWLNFVVDCRRGKEHSYDLVKGPMADDQIYSYIENYISGEITRAAFWELIRFKYPTNQVAFCSVGSLSCIDYVSSERVVKYGRKSR